MEEKELEMAEAGENTEGGKEEITEGEFAEEAAEPSVPPYARRGKGIRISGPMLYENSFIRNFLRLPWAGTGNCIT